MLKYVNTGVVFQEIPDEVTLSINISKCPCHCPGCHSKYLWEDIGEPLTAMQLNELVKEYINEITCVCFMGGDAEPEYKAFGMPETAHHQPKALQKGSGRQLHRHHGAILGKIADVSAHKKKPPILQKICCVRTHRLDLYQ